MNRFRFEVATEADDEALRDLLRRTPMDGQMRISFRREPSFFSAAVVEGEEHQTLVCRDAQADDQIVAMGCRAKRRCWINGHPETIGYLSGLRIDRSTRGQSVLARGYRLLRQLHQQDPLPLYLSTIATGNQQAWRLLTSGRAGLPRYQHIGDYLSIAIPLSQRPRRFVPPARQGDYEMRFAGQDELPSLLNFWNQYGPRQQFFPVLSTANFHSLAGTMRGLLPANILLALHRGKIVGTLGCWDQTSFRQTVVHEYGWCLTWTRPMINAWAGLTNRAGLPQVGQPLRLLFAALPVVREEHLGCFKLLLRTCMLKYADGLFSHLVLGLSGQDPLLAEIPKRSGPIYRTRICLVHWDHQPLPIQLAQDRPIYLEAGCL